MKLETIENGISYYRKIIRREETKSGGLRCLSQAWATSSPIGNMTIKGVIFHRCQKMIQSKTEYQ